MGTRPGFANINGSGYGVTLGEIISTTTTTGKSRQLIDGFVRAPQKTSVQTKSAQFHKRAQRAQTLMRAGLKRPANRQQPQVHSTAANPKIETQLRAKTVAKHGRVNRFGNPISASRVVSAFKPSNRPLSGEIVSAGHGSAAAQGAAATPLPSMVTSASHQKLERLLDEALANADAHKQALKHQAARHFWHRRWLSGRRLYVVLAFVLAVTAIGGFYAWQNVPQLSMKLAGIKAHLSAVVPSYQPDGYKLASPAKAASGTVSIKYKSAADPNQTYDVTEAQSNLTGNTVAQNVVPKGAAVRTSQVDGNTVYIYGAANNAAWVNNGVLYKISNSASLTSDQLIKIVQGINP